MFAGRAWEKVTVAEAGRAGASRCRRVTGAGGKNSLLMEREAFAENSRMRLGILKCPLFEVTILGDRRHRRRSTHVAVL